jgi:phosphoribosylformylglycinamidine synthase
LLEAGMPNGLGFSVETDSDFRKDAYLFGEAQSRVVASINPDNQDEFVEHMVASGLEYTFLGTVEGKEMLIDGDSFGTIADAKHQFETALENRLNS